MSEGNDNPQDPRPEFFGNYIIKALKVKSEKWFRLMVTEEQGTKVYNFLDNPECIVLIIFQVSQLNHNIFIHLKRHHVEELFYILI